MKKITIYFFLRIIDINDRFNVRRSISCYNVKHIKDNIYETKTKGIYMKQKQKETILGWRL